MLAHARPTQGQELLITDYLDSYEWLSKNTPEDARVLSWWDYGYQVGNRGSVPISDFSV